MIEALSFMINYLNIFSEPLFNTGFMASTVSCFSGSLYYLTKRGKLTLGIILLLKKFVLNFWEIGETFKPYTRC